MNLKKIYREIAKQYGVSVSEVKHDIQAAIDETYKAPNLYARSVYYEGDKPTSEEFIAHIVRRIQTTDDLRR